MRVEGKKRGNKNFFFGLLVRIKRARIEIFARLLNMVVYQCVVLLFKFII